MEIRDMPKWDVTEEYFKDFYSFVRLVSIYTSNSIESCDIEY